VSTPQAQEGRGESKTKTDATSFGEYSMTLSRKKKRLKKMMAVC
jgi:hypothetical protein